MTNAEIIWKYFENKKFNPYAIAGIMGNMKAESNLLPNNLQDTYERSLGMTNEQYTKAVDNGTYTNFIHDSAGYGLVQWTYWSLKEGLYNLCKERGKSISDINCQLDCLYQQLTNNKLLGSLNAATSIRAASDIFLTKFERPKDQSEKVQITRANYGQEFYNQFAGQTVKGGTQSKMKYSNTNKPLICMMTNSTCYKGTGKMAVKGVLWHCTGANNPWLKRYVQPSDNASDKAELLAKLGTNQYRNDWNHVSVEAGLNAWVGKLANGTVAAVQTMPWDYRPWGCGSSSRGSCNNGWIQFEICEDALTDKAYFEAAYKEACELTAYLCKMFNLNPKGNVSFNGTSVPVILCHQDSYRLGLGSNHGDVYNWFNRYGKTMDNVRNDVAALMANSGTIIPDPTPTPTPINPSSSCLGKGDEGPEVEQLQKNLIKLGYSCGSWGADGDFGNDTEKAVIKFQKEHGLDADGLVGPLTQVAIKTALEKLTPTPTPTPSPNEIYRIRLSWDNPASQIGAYKILENAINACKTANGNYKVFNSKGEIIYPISGNTQTTIITPVTTIEEPITTIIPAIKYNGVMLGSASHDERGSYRGGSAGDSTGTEVAIQNWYRGNWDTVLRPKTALLAEKIAAASEQACGNNKIGYDQNQRNTLLTEVKKVGYNMSKITVPCECDCSSLVSTCCVCAGLPESIFFAGGNGRTTWTMQSACEATSQFDVLKASKYTQQKDYLMRGDILLQTDMHVVIVLSDGDKAEGRTNSESSNNFIISPKSSAKECPYIVTINVDILNVRSGPGTNYPIRTKVTRNYKFTIVEESEGWGRLKSGAGWIDLQYTKR